MPELLGTHHGFPCRHEDGPAFHWAAAGLDVRATRDGLFVTGASLPMSGDLFGRTMALLAFASVVADYLMGVGGKGSIEPMLERLRKRADQPAPDPRV